MWGAAMGTEVDKGLMQTDESVFPRLACRLDGLYCQASPPASIAAKGGSYAVRVRRYHL